MGDDVRVTVGCKVDPLTRQKLRLIAAAQDTSMSEILREKVDEVIEEFDIPEDHLEILVEEPDIADDGVDDLAQPDA